MTRTAIVIAAVLAFAATLPPASAQAQRFFVAATGSDGNPCTFASPCRSFQHAHDVASSGGEIDVLDPAGYGALTIIKSISIQGHGFSGISVGASATAVTITAGASDIVSLNGLLIDGATVGATGVQFNSGNTLNIANCVIRGFGNTGTGINFAPQGTGSFGSSNFYISNTLVASNGIGIGVLAQGTGNVSVVL